MMKICAGTADWHVVVGTLLRFSVAMAQKQIPAIIFMQPGTKLS